MRISSLFPVLLTVTAALAVWVSVTADCAYAKPRPGAASFTMSESIAACNEVLRSSKNSINCVVIDVRGHPTLAVEFVSEESMRAHLGTFSQQVAAPFCEAANEGGEQAFFVVALKDPRKGSVSWCETGKSSGWVSISSLELN